MSDRSPVEILAEVSAMLDAYREASGRHGLADLILYEELDSSDDLAPNFQDAKAAMQYVLDSGLTTYEESFFGDDNFMTAEYETLREFISEHGLTQEED